MKGLQTGRVVVVDNTPYEAVLIIRAFAKAGIASTYYTGAIEEMPESPLKGIRLVALDLHLDGDESQESKAMLGHALGVLKLLIDPNNGPLMILAWTKHPQLVEELKEKLPSACPAATPSFVVTFDKTSLIDAEGHVDIEKIISELNLAVQQWSPFDLMLYWEQLVHDSASETTRALSSLQPSDSFDHWKNSLRLTLKKMGEASTGKIVLDENGKSTTQNEVFLRGILETLHPLHNDRLEHFAGVMPHSLNKSTSFIQKESSPSIVSLEEINRMLILVPVSAGDKVVRPGNLYAANGWTPNSNRFPIKREVLIEELIEKNKQITEMENTNVQPVLVEITPMCDFAQKKNRQARLLAGLLVPVNTKKNLINKGRADFMNVLGGFSVKAEDRFGVPEGMYCLALTARYLCSQELRRLGRCQPVARIRHQGLVGVQAWFASHAARPGMLTLTT